MSRDERWPVMPPLPLQCPQSNEAHSRISNLRQQEHRPFRTDQRLPHAPAAARRSIPTRKPHKLCLDCWRSTRRRRPLHQAATDHTNIGAVETASHVTQVSAIDLDHQIITKKDLQKGVSGHSKINFPYLPYDRTADSETSSRLMALPIQGHN